MRAESVGVGQRAESLATARSRTRAAALVAALLGTVLIWGVGFSPIAVLHNAAHDVRHSLAFPCH